MISQNSNYILGRYKIISSLSMVKPKKKVVKRSWKERLFSFPWHPFQKTKVVTYNVPDETVLKMDDKIICHPTIYEKILEIYNQNKEM